MLFPAINLLNAVANDWSAWILVTFVNTAGLMFLLGMIWLLIRRRVSPQIGYWLFLLVPLKLLVPVQIALPIAVADWESFTIDGPAEHTGETASQVLETKTPALSSPPHSAEQPVSMIDIAAPPPSPDFEPRTVPPREMAVAQSVVAPTPPTAPATPPLSRPTPLAIVMLLWLASVFVLTGRWFIRHWRFHRQLKTAVTIDPDQYSVDLRKLCQRAGISARVRFVESDQLSAPAVAGVLRPTMILPKGLATALTSRQIEWAVLHELAHIGRGDLAVILLQRFAAILHFFNPAVWIANRLANRLREYACDDLASAWAGGSPIETGEAFVQVLRFASSRQTKPAVGLGILGLDTRSACAQRVRRMLNRRENAIVRSNRWSVLALILIAALALPHLRAGDEATKAEESTEDINKTETTAEPKATPKEPQSPPADNAAKNTFELIVVGPDEKPVPSVEVEFRRPSKPSAEDVLIGTFVKQLEYGSLVEADARGRMVLNRSNLKKNIQFIIEQPGFGPYYYSSFPNHATPDKVAVHLDKAWSVGSRIVDSEGNPISGVKVRPSIKHKRPPGVHDQMGVGTNITTDVQGRWHYDSVPVSMDDVFVEINHPDYMPLRTSLTRAKYEITPGAAPTASVRLKSGLTVHGRVTDESGKPIQGALLRIDFLNDERTDKTDADGHYEVIGCEPGLTQIVVSAEDQAIDARKINIVPEMKPVNFEMKPGGTVRIHVLDHQGNPVPKARIFFQDWRGDDAYFAFDRVNQYANEQGIWEWNEAPHDEFTADICQDDGMDLSEQPLIAREKEYVFRLPPALVISGEVVDAETKEPIKTFEVVQGLRSPDEFISWEWNDKFIVTDGTYKTRFNRQQPGYFVRIQAEGYQAAVSREVQYNEGQVTIDFALKKGINVTTQILTPDGEPAGGAEIALGIADSQISVKNGHIRDSSTYAARDTADEQGHFQFPPQNSDYQLVITHPTGYAHIKDKPGQKLEPITLTAWARIEGTFFAGDELVPDARITIASGNLHSYGEGVPSVFEAYDTTTEPDGTFTFNRVVPGPARIGRSIVRMVDTGATEVASSKMIPVKTKPGETLKIRIGGDGRPVTGKLVPPADFEKEIIWPFADIDLRIAPPPPPDIPEGIRNVPEKARKWFTEWKKTPAGKKWTAIQTEYERQRKQKPYYNASVARDGSFRIDNVTAGDYLLNVRFQKDTNLHLRQSVTVPPITDKTRGKPIELGALTLE